MEFFGVVSAETDQVVEFLPTREQAEAMIRDVEGDEPELAKTLRVERVEFETAAN
jgi:hypothetical protein